MTILFFVETVPRGNQYISIYVLSTHACLTNSCIPFYNSEFNFEIIVFRWDDISYYQIFKFM